MFNILVSGRGNHWEGDILLMGVDRFGEYSGDETNTVIRLDQSDTLQFLEEIPTLLMYEGGDRCPNSCVVRHGRLRNIARQGKNLTFSFEPDAERAYLNRRFILEYADRLGMESFEFNHTHWAIKDGDNRIGHL